MKSFEVYSPYVGFKTIFNHVMNCHDVITTEDGAVTYESDSVCIKIKNPLAEPEKLIGAYCMGPGAVRDYISQFNDGVNTKGFEYTYYERLTQYGLPEYNESQIENIVEKLKDSRDTRRAVAILWQPWSDSRLSDPPCLNWIQAVIRKGNLNLKVLFRSHDILKGWPSNILAIAEMQRRMAEELEVDVGYLEVISSIPHIYIKSDADLVKKTMGILK
jgi:thymidylate synthase